MNEQAEGTIENGQNLPVPTMQVGIMQGNVLKLPPKSITVRNIRDCKRLLSRLLSRLQRGEILGQDAKDQCYLLNTYAQICRDHDFEERIAALEKQERNSK